MNIVTAIFDAIVKQMTKMSHQKLAKMSQRKKAAVYPIHIDYEEHW